MKQIMLIKGKRSPHA